MHSLFYHAPGGLVPRLLCIVSLRCLVVCVNIIYIFRRRFLSDTSDCLRMCIAVPSTPCTSEHPLCARLARHKIIGRCSRSPVPFAADYIKGIGFGRCWYLLFFLATPLSIGIQFRGSIGPSFGSPRRPRVFTNVASPVNRRLPAV